MSETIDNNTFPGFSPDGGLDEMEAAMGGAQPDGATKPKGQFPVFLVAGVFAGVVVLLGGAFAYVTLRGHSSHGDQMVDLPQPQMQTAQMQPQQPNVPPLPPGVPNNAGYQPGQAPLQAQLAGQSQQQYAPNGQPLQIQQTAAQPGTQMAPVNAAPANPVANGYNTGAIAPGAMTQNQQQYAQQAPSAPAPVMQTPQQAVTSGNPVAQADMPAPAVVTGTGGMQGVSPPVQQVAKTEPQPAGPVPIVEGRHAARVSHAANAGTDIGALQAQVNDLARKQQELLDLLKQKQPAATTRTKTAKAAPVAVQKTDDQSTDADAQDAPEAEKPVHTRPTKKGRGNAKAAKADKFTRDSGHVLTGMIDNRAFVSRTSGGDVNSSTVLAPGDTLEDGRKVLSIDAKNKRVWLEGNQYISVAPADASE